MSKYSTQIISNIYKDKSDGAIRVGKRWMERLVSVKVHGTRLGSRTMDVTHRNGQVYTVVQADRDCYYVRAGEHLNGDIDVNGWADAVRMLNDM